MSKKHNPYYHPIPGTLSGMVAVCEARELLSVRQFLNACEYHYNDKPELLEGPGYLYTVSEEFPYHSQPMLVDLEYWVSDGRLPNGHGPIGRTSEEAWAKYYQALHYRQLKKLRSSNIIARQVPRFLHSQRKLLIDGVFK